MSIGVICLKQKEFLKKLEDFENLTEIQLLKNFSQHRGNTTFQHCKNVTLYSYLLAKRWNIDVDEDALITAGMLHDYYLYNTKDMDISDYRHGVTHPQTAIRNAEKHFELNSKVRNIIASHMWPLPFSPLPRSKEAALINIADKYCAFKEMCLGVRVIEKLG